MKMIIIMKIMKMIIMKMKIKIIKMNQNKFVFNVNSIEPINLIVY